MGSYFCSAIRFAKAGGVSDGLGYPLAALSGLGFSRVTGVIDCGGHFRLIGE